MNQFKNTDIEHYKKKWSEFTVFIATNDSDKLVRAAAFEVLGEWKVVSARKFMVKALGYSSYALAGAALEALYKIDSDTAYTVAKEIMYNDPKGGLETAVWSVIGKKGADNDIVNYERRAQYVFNTKRFIFATSLNNYLRNVKSDASFGRGIDIYTRFIETESLKSYRAAMAEMLFEVAGEQKDNSKPGTAGNPEQANKRYNIVKAALQKITSEEKDPENLRSYQRKMKDISGS
jgi:HEAT repeat protein